MIVMEYDTASTDQSAANDPIFYAITEAVYEVTGMRVPFTRETRMDRYFEEVVGADSLEYLELSFVLQEKLGVWLDDKDWNFLSGGREAHISEEWELKYAQFFTFGRLADLVASRAAFAAPAPVTILGVTSKAAGAFRHIRSVSREIAPSVEPFGPSTVITERFKGRKLRKLWERLRLMSCGRIPPLEATGMERAANQLYNTPGVLLVLGLGTVTSIVLFSTKGAPANIGCFGFVLMVALIALLLAGVFGAMAAMVTFVLRRLGKVSREWNLPHGITTFRDLAELIAGVRGGWCGQCGYDLTGLTGGVCPECGEKFAHPVGK